VARIGITVGDVSGIGPEIVIKAVARLEGRIPDLVIIGPGNAINALQTMYKNHTPLPPVADTGDIEFEFGKVQKSTGQAAIAALEKGTEMIKSGKLHALVTAPVNKKAIQMSAPSFTGHTEFLAHRFNADEVLMIAHSPYVSFALVTTHHPIRKVPDLITADRVGRKIELYHQFLLHLHSQKARIAVLNLNPHGKEFSAGEEQAIEDAILQAQQKGIMIQGPYPADTFHLYTEKVDGFLAQYHDQGMIPAKLLSQGQGVNVTWGLGFVRTSPLHGTAFDIAGKDKADPESMVSAIKLAATLSRS
jgi:4-hydroxythreonine-4-phosphate dehydrogenase